MTAKKINPIVWSGGQKFSIMGTNRHEDTLRIESNYLNMQTVEEPLKLILPTLCITYADMNFSNAIGGEQKSYPDSAHYGNTYFNPPLEIITEKEVEKYTWIRGAHRVVIGPERTTIEWYIKNDLVLPRLRIKTDHSVEAILTVPELEISVDKKFVMRAMQYADGRHLGGIRIEKRHPKWTPESDPQEYDLLVRIVDGDTMQPIPEVKLNLFRWDPNVNTSFGKGSFQLMEEFWTDNDGAIYSPKRPSGELEAVVIYLPGWRALPRCFRPLPGERVHLHLRAWQLKGDFIRYTLKEGDTLQKMAAFSGCTIEDILIHNNIADPAMLMPGMEIDLACYEAIYNMEENDSFEWLARAFDYSDIEKLAEFNGLASASQLTNEMDILLLGWHFFYAPQGTSLEQIDTMFDLPPGSSRTLGRIFNPHPKLPYIGETIAIPNSELAAR